MPELHRVSAILNLEMTKNYPSPPSSPFPLSIFFTSPLLPFSPIKNPVKAVAFTGQGVYEVHRKKPDSLSKIFPTSSGVGFTGLVATVASFNAASIRAGFCSS